MAGRSASPHPQDQQRTSKAMPTYVYECPQCKRSKEIFLKITEEPPVWCNMCTILMSRVIQPSTFVLKGNCWAKDGYKK